MATIGNLWINVKSNTTGLSKGLGKAKGMLGKFGKFAASPAGIATAAFAGLTAGIFAMGKALKFAIKEFMAFEAAMAEVKSILIGVSNSDFARLEDSAKKLGATTAFTAEEAAKGMTNLARAGFNTNEILSATPPLLDLAAATGMELAEAADIAAVSVRGFGLEASDTAHVADVLALAASKTNTTVQEMGDAFSYVAPVAAQMGFSIEETSAMLGKLADAGIKGSKGGTALRTVMLKMAKEIDEKGTPALKEYLVEGHGLQENFEKFGKLGVVAVGVLQKVVEETDELKVSMEQANGVVAEMAAIRLDTLSGDVTILKSAISGLAVAVGEELSPAMRTGTQAATGFFGGMTAGFNALNTEVQDSGTQLNLWNGILMVVGDVIITFTAIIKFLWNVMQAAFYAIVGIVAGALGALMKLFEWASIGVQKFFGLFMDTSDWDIGNVFGDMADNLKSEMNSAFVEVEIQAGEGVHAVTGGLIDAYVAQYDAMFSAGEEGGKQSVEGLAGGIKDGTGKVVEAVENLTQVQQDLITAAQELNPKLQEQITYFGMTAAEILNAKAATAELTSATIAQSLALEQELQALKDNEQALQEATDKHDRLKDAATSLIESLRTPDQVYEDEVAKLKKMMDAKLLTYEQHELALAKLRKGTEKDIEVNIITKGIVEGLQSALGSIKVAGNVSTTEQLAKQQVETSKKIEQVMTAVRENTAAVKQETVEVANNTQDVANKLAGTLTTDVTGLESMMGTVVTSIDNVSNTMTLENVEALITTTNDLSVRQFVELQNVNRNLKELKSGGALS